MSLPEILTREEQQSKSLLAITEKLEAIIGLVNGSNPMADRPDKPAFANASGFICEMLFQQELVDGQLNNLHNRLDDFRSMLGWSQEVAKANPFNEKAFNSSLAQAIAGDLKNGTFKGASPDAHR